MQRWLLLLHLLSLLAWLGPSVGGTYIYLAARRQGNPTLISWSLRQSLALYNLEHLSFLAVLFTGITLLAGSGWAFLAAPWFLWKLGLVAGLIIPVEIWDVYVIRRLRNALPASRHDTVDPQPDTVDPQLARAIRAHDAVLIWGGALFTAGVLGALGLAVLKPAF